MPVPCMASLCCLKSRSPWYDTHLFVFLTLFFNYLVFFASCPDRGVGGFLFLPLRERFSFRLPRAGKAPPSRLCRFSGAGRLLPRGRRSMEKSPMGAWWNLGGIGGSKPGVTLKVSLGLLFTELAGVNPYGQGCWYHPARTCPLSRRIPACPARGLPGGYRPSPP